jgi:hypothetical protein
VYRSRSDQYQWKAGRQALLLLHEDGSYDFDGYEYHTDDRHNIEEIYRYHGSYLLDPEADLITFRQSVVFHPSAEGLARRELSNPVEILSAWNQGKQLSYGSWDSYITDDSPRTLYEESYWRTLDAEDDLARVIFEVFADVARFGEDVYVVGDHANLGEWDPMKALRLQNQSQAGEPCIKWSGETRLPAETNITYKYILREGDKLRWEGGDNRSLTTGRSVKYEWGGTRPGWAEFRGNE